MKLSRVRVKTYLSYFWAGVRVVLRVLDGSRVEGGEGDAMDPEIHFVT